MTTQQTELKRAIEERGWEIVEVIDDTLPWWAYAIWVIESRWSPSDVRFVVTLIVDPMYERGAKQGYVERAVVSRDVLSSRLSDDVLGKMTMQQRCLDELPSFIHRLDELRLIASRE